MNDFLEKMRTYLDKGVEVSKEAVKAAGEKVQDFGDKSMTFIEMKQLENRIEHSLQKLGLRVYEMYEEDAEADISVKDEIIQQCLKDLSYLNKEIDKRNSRLDKDKQ